MLADAWVLLDLAYGTLVFEVFKRSAPLPSLVRRVASPRARPVAVDVDRAVRIVGGALRRAYRHDYCLPRSLVLYRVLARAGRQPRLRIGVRRDGGGLGGHAWVTLDGHPLAEAADPAAAFATTFQFPLTPTDP